MLVGYLGPEGTFTHEALMADPAAGSFELRPLPTVYDTIMAVQRSLVDRALVPIEARQSMGQERKACAQTSQVAAMSKIRCNWRIGFVLGQP